MLAWGIVLVLVVGESGVLVALVEGFVMMLDVIMISLFHVTLKKKCFQSGAAYLACAIEW